MTRNQNCSTRYWAAFHTWHDLNKNSSLESTLLSSTTRLSISLPTMMVERLSQQQPFRRPRMMVHYTCVETILTSLRNCHNSLVWTLNFPHPPSVVANWKQITIVPLLGIGLCNFQISPSLKNEFTRHSASILHIRALQYDSERIGTSSRCSV